MSCAPGAQALRHAALASVNDVCAWKGDLLLLRRYLALQSLWNDGWSARRLSRYGPMLIRFRPLR